MFARKPPHPASMPPPPRKPLPSAVIGYSGPEQWKPVTVLDHFYRGRAFISTLGRIYHWTEKRGWHIVRPHTSKRNGRNLVRLVGPDGKARTHYPVPLLEGAFLHSASQPEVQHSPLDLYRTKRYGRERRYG